LPFPAAQSTSSITVGPSEVMNGAGYVDFFRCATGLEVPYAYQCRLACGPQVHLDKPAALQNGAECRSQLIEVPTGLGKTAAVLMAWLWNRVIQPDEAARSSWPRRLVYCLPMRTLVEQTRKNVRRWLERLAKNYDSSDLQWLAEHSPVVLMGGEEPDGTKGDWDLYPEKLCVLIGTQDMLLSRALNRGYAMSRYRWPIHFGLLNNDALWVMDETQLMGVAVETTAQLNAFRHEATDRTFGRCPTWWMSATLDAAQLATVDHPEPEAGWLPLTLTEPDHAVPSVRDRYNARKPIAPAPFHLSSATKGGYAKELAHLVAQRHQPGTFTLIVVNRVRRAQELYRALRKVMSGHTPKGVALIHSRFRPGDRRQHEQIFEIEGDRIVIATQAVEAGVDISARLLITELAPWASLVQRFGRCNRQGNLPNAEVFWVDIEPKDEKDELVLPYDVFSLKIAREQLQSLADVGPQSLAHINVPAAPVVRPVLRRRDLIDLFDTTPDLCGQDLDVSRYVRDGEDHDVQLFWRVIPASGPDEDTSPPSRDELCRVSVGDLRKFLDRKKASVWSWNPLSKEWERVQRARPGAVYLIDRETGGYSDAEGWTLEPDDKPTLVERPSERPESYDDNRSSIAEGVWVSLTEHTTHVVEETDGLAGALNLDAALRAVLRTAALWHDVGKAHPVFQQMLTGWDDVPSDKRSELQAKSDKFRGGPRRPNFRHELASALAWLIAGPFEVPERDLTAFAIAAHHGRVRLSIRSLSEEETQPDDPQRLYARGVWDGDQLPTIPLGEVTIPPITLDLSSMQMGSGPHGASWLARMIALRDQLGPFRVAFLETVLRAADGRASAREKSHPPTPES